MLCITNNSIKYQSFVYTQVNDQTVLFLTIQFSTSHLFAPSLKGKQFYLIHRQDPIRCYHSSPVSNWEQWQWMGPPHSPKLQALLDCLVSYAGHLLQRRNRCILQPQPPGFNWNESTPCDLKLSFYQWNYTSWSWYLYRISTLLTKYSQFVEKFDPGCFPNLNEII